MSRTTDLIAGFGLGFIAFTEIGNNLAKQGIHHGTKFMKPYLQNMGLFNKNVVQAEKPTVTPVAPVAETNKEDKVCTN